MTSRLLQPGMKIKKRYVIGSKLGEGTYGTVWKGRDTVWNDDVAIKVVKKATSNIDKDDETAVGEARILSMLSGCPGTPNLYEYFSWRKHNVIIMELLRGDFLSLLEHHPQQKLSRKTVLHFAFHLVTTLEAVHSYGILHRDVKLANVMLPLKQTPTVKLVLGDFGFGYKFESNLKRKGMRLRVPSRDYDYTLSTYHSLRMNRGQPAQEVDDLEMASYTILETVNIRPFLGRTMPDVVHVKEQFLFNPRPWLTTETSYLTNVITLLLNQEYGQSPDYEKVYKKIRSLNRNVSINRNFVLGRAPNGCHFIKDF
ncbi:unnamed protein product [Caenorhabditis brenneri]